MCGVIFCTTSPSVWSSSLSTPCVLGCCGPMLRIISSPSKASTCIATPTPLSQRLENGAESPLGRGEGQALGGYSFDATTHPVRLRNGYRCAGHPSEEGSFLIT